MPFKIESDRFVVVEDLEIWRTEACSQAYHAISETYAELLSTLSSTVESGQVLIVDAAVRKADVFKSLDEERAQLIHTTARTPENDTVTTVGQSMRAFEALVEAERRNEEALWDEWDLVQAKIVALGLEILGPEAFGSHD